MKTRIPIKKYVPLDWLKVESLEDLIVEFKKLEAHHVEETEFLIRTIGDLETEVEQLQEQLAQRRMPWDFSDVTP